MPFVSRADWGARARRGYASSLRTDLVTIHWEGPRMGTFPHDQCAGKVRGIQRFHMDPKPRGRAWQDIAYSGVVCPHGYVFEGRGRGVRTGANGTNVGNASAHALCALVGVGDPITDALLDGIAEGVAWLGGRRTNAHRDWKPTECPGDILAHHAHTGRFLRPVTPKPAPTPTPPPSEELTVAQIDDLMKRLDTLERASNRNYTAVLNAGAVLLELRDELLAPKGSDGSTRADRMATVPDAVRRLEAAVAELHKASEG